MHLGNHTGNSSARMAMSNYILTTDKDVVNTADYKKISNVIYRLMESGVTFAAKGYCISMSDIVYTMLNQVGIKCKIIECSAAIDNKKTNQLYVVGYDGLKDQEDRTDTHVVVVTETDIPMIIDVSIAHLLPNNLQGVIDVCCDIDGEIIANISSNDVCLTYKRKQHFNVPMLHQLSIVDRIKTDLGIITSIKMLRVLIIAAVVVSCLNATRGMYDAYQVYVVNDNHWGPDALRQIDEKLNKLGEQVDKLNQGL